MHRDITIRVSELTFKRLMKLKSDENYAEKDFGSWLTAKAGEVTLMFHEGEAIQQGTRNSLLEVWVQNFAHNLPKIWAGKSIAGLITPEIEARPDEGHGPAIVVGRGPSMFANKHLELLATSKFDGLIMATDGALIECLTRGVVPNYVVSVDGNRELIPKWYRHPLVKKFGGMIKAIVATSVAPQTIEAIEEAGMDYYWFIPIFDDFRSASSFTEIERMATRTEKDPKGCILVSAGGHSGATTWILSWSVLRRSPVALIGIDLGYRPDTKLEETYYFPGLLAQAGGNVDAVMPHYKEVYNPEFDCTCIQDPVFRHYRYGFLEMLRLTPKWVQTQNCTEGGALFGEGITCRPFKDFLAQHSF